MDVRDTTFRNNRAVMGAGLSLSTAALATVTTCILHNNSSVSRSTRIPLHHCSHLTQLPPRTPPLPPLTAASTSPEWQTLEPQMQIKSAFSWFLLLVCLLPPTLAVNPASPLHARSLLLRHDVVCALRHSSVCFGLRPPPLPPLLTLSLPAPTMPSRSATTLGGAAFVLDGVLAASGCMFSSNSAPRYGAIAVAQGGVLNATNCTWFNNDAEKMVRHPAACMSCH